MKKVITTALLTAALVATGCASTPSSSDTGYVIKVNGAETNTERSKKPNYLIPALVLGVGLAAGVAITSGGSDSGSSDDDKARQYQNCISAGHPADYCRRTVYGG